MLRIMDKTHSEWDEFTTKLQGPEGCNVRIQEGTTDTLNWDCDGNHTFTKKILANFPDIDIEGSIKYFEDNGGYCDCEILLNVVGVEVID